MTMAQPGTNLKAGARGDARIGPLEVTGDAEHAEPKRDIAGVVAVALLMQASPVLATHQTNSLWRNYYNNGHNNTVWYCFDPSFPGGNYQYRVNDARAAWNNVHSELYFVWNSYPTCGELVVYWHDIQKPFYDNLLGWSIVVSCPTPPDRHCSAEITLDDNAAGNTWYTGIGTPPSGQYDLRSMASHEWGHITSLRHSTDPSFVMYPNLGPTIVRYIPKCHESDTLRTMYGSDGTPTCRP